jgi:hypothetical protein
VVELAGSEPIAAPHGLSPRQREVLAAGGLIEWVRRQRG